MLESFFVEQGIRVSMKYKDIRGCCTNIPQTMNCGFFFTVFHKARYAPDNNKMDTIPLSSRKGVPTISKWSTAINLITLFLTLLRENAGQFFHKCCMTDLFLL